MSRTVAIILGLALITLLFAGSYLYVTWTEPAPPEPVAGEPFPTLRDDQIALPTSLGEEVAANDFLNDGETKPDPANDGVYYLAGTIGYCADGLPCETVETADFTVKYDDNAKAFAVGIATEPIGEVRRRAEEFLAKKLGLTEDQMCALNYYVGTTYWVNETYAGVNLGWSYCPGATPLPE